MAKLAPHPSREELSAYSLGQLPEERAVAIDSHISECEPCCETIVELSSEDTFAGLLQEAALLPTDQTADHDSASANSASFDDIPQPLSEHPRYEILDLIGKGGMGDVYKARHRKMERTVALKVINRGLVQKPEAIDRFHREVKAAAQLSHPNIVTSHDADHAGDFHFMVMEYVDGVDLSQTVKERGALPVAEACDYIRQAALGLQQADERGMVHRDIKPHNLMVTADGTIKILDFGLASLAPDAIPASDAVSGRSELTAVGAIMGTPDFISPEQAKDARQVDIRSDIYSLGATLYYLLSGRVPFDDGSVMHKLKSHAQVEPASLSSVRDEVPEELVGVVSKMMAKNPDERYLTPKEVAEALESFLRTWQPDEADSEGRLFAASGNNFVPVVKDSSTGDAGRNWLFVVAAVLILGCIGCLAAGLFYTNGNIGGIRVEVTAPEDLGNLGSHPLTIVDTSGKKPLGGTTSTHQDDASGITIHSFTSANGRYNITLVDEVLTVNGERYTLENPTDAIRIVDDQVEITQVAALPSKPELKITGKTVNKGTSGLPSVYDWNFEGRGVGELKVRLLLAQNGETEVIQEFDLEELPAEFANKVRLEVRDVGTGVDRKRRVNAIVFVGGPVPSRRTSINEDEGLSIDVEAPFSNKTEPADLEPIEPRQTELLLALSYWKGDMTHDLSMESMTAATKGGNATFLFVTLDWKPRGENKTGNSEVDLRLLQGDQQTESLTEESDLGSNNTPTRAAQERDADAAPRQAGQQQSDNHLQMPLCWCPAGEFKMGRKQLPVTLTRGFWMGKHEVTQAQYEALMGDNPSENKGESLPVEKVAWNAAKKFCQKFTELERKAGRLPQGWEYRLPTEAQWEYACRAGTTLIWDDEKDLVYPSAFGNDLSELGEYAWYSENSDGSPHPVGQKKPNAWGLCDMHGNVGEWVRDAWQSKLSGGQDPEVDVSLPIHARRGGDWFSYTEPCGSPFIRGFVVAGREVPHMMGFRVALVSVGDSGDGTAASGNLGRLQGDWDVIAFTQNGNKEYAVDNGVGMLVQIKGETITRIQTAPNGEKSETEWGRIALNSQTNPKSIDIVNPDGPGGRLLGIYELNDGVLRICFVEQSDIDVAEGKPVKRPTKFDAPAGSEMVLLECQGTVEDPEVKQLQGVWEAASVTEGGKQLAAEKGFGSILLEINGDSFAITEASLNGEKSDPDTGGIEINSMTDPKTIDFIDRNHSDRRSRGIYELKDGVLRLCLVEQVGTDVPRDERNPDTQTLKRPKTFESPTGSNMMLMEFHRKSDNDLQTREDARSLPLVQVLHDAEGLTAKRVKIIGTFLVTDNKFGVRTYQISTAHEDLPPPPNEGAYRDREITFEVSFDEEEIINVGQFHNKRVLATGPIYYFPADSVSPAKVIFMMDGIHENPSQGNADEEVPSAVPGEGLSMLHNQPDEISERTVDLMSVIRKAVLPQDFATERDRCRADRIEHFGPAVRSSIACRQSDAAQVRPII